MGFIEGATRTEGSFWGGVPVIRTWGLFSGQGLGFRGVAFELSGLSQYQG